MVGKGQRKGNGHRVQTRYEAEGGGVARKRECLAGQMFGELSYKAANRLPLRPALQKMRRRVRTYGADLYVVRVTKSTGRFGNARPCARCVAWSEWAGVRRIYYWDDQLEGFKVIKVGYEQAGTGKN
jgi:hypothetical protein